MARVRGRDTTPERLVRRMVHRLGHRFRLHRAELPGKPDLVFPSKQRVIFVHGCFWHHHSCKRGTRPRTNEKFWDEKLLRNQRRDQAANRALKRAGWKVLVVWECETKNVDRLGKRLSEFLSS